MTTTIEALPTPREVKVRLRALEPGADYYAAAAILAKAAQDDQDTFALFVPSEATCKPVQIAEDGSAAVFEVYTGDGWTHDDGKALAPLGRILVAERGTRRAARSELDQSNAVDR